MTLACTACNTIRLSPSREEAAGVDWGALADGTDVRGPAEPPQRAGVATSSKRTKNARGGKRPGGAAIAPVAAAGGAYGPRGAIVDSPVVQLQAQYALEVESLRATNSKLRNETKSLGGRLRCQQRHEDALQRTLAATVTLTSPAPSPKHRGGPAARGEHGATAERGAASANVTASGSGWEHVLTLRSGTGRDAACPGSTSLVSAGQAALEIVFPVPTALVYTSTEAPPRSFVCFFRRCGHLKHRPDTRPSGEAA